MMHDSHLEEADSLLIPGLVIAEHTADLFVERGAIKGSVALGPLLLLR